MLQDDRISSKSGPTRVRWRVDRALHTGRTVHLEPSLDRANGFSLLEALIAMTVLIVGVCALANLSGVSTHANTTSRRITFATLLAVDKMEQLRALTWDVDALGQSVSDTTTDLTTFPATAAGGVGLSPSPPDALSRNAAGYCDFLDGSGRSLGGGTLPPPQSIFVRRWSIAPLPASPSHTLILQVRVTGTHLTAGASSRPDEARLVTVKTRKAIR